jgi:uncharacterized protein (TIGR00730 family)
MPAITVYTSASKSIDEKFLTAAFELGKAIAQQGWTLNYGGNHVGSMGRLADGARAGAGRVVGITPTFFNDEGIADKRCDELILVDSMRSRKALLEHRGDAFVALPGGIGTLEELIEIWVGKHLGTCKKPLILLDLGGFWQPLVSLVRQGIASGFYRKNSLDIITLVPSVVDCITALSEQLHMRDKPAGS